jgi:predicted nuclease with TOPRIM domain
LITLTGKTDLEGTGMREQLQNRLEELKKEFETGQGRLKELEAEQAYVRETMLRISGAIQVLEEALRESEQSEKVETQPA